MRDVGGFLALIASLLTAAAGLVIWFFLAPTGINEVAAAVLWTGGLIAMLLCAILFQLWDRKA